MTTAPDQPKRRGRPALPESERMTGRIVDRLPQDVADKYRQLGRDWLIGVIRRARVPST